MGGSLGAGEPGWPVQGFVKGRLEEGDRRNLPKVVIRTRE